MKKSIVCILAVVLSAMLAGCSGLDITDPKIAATERPDIKELDSKPNDKNMIQLDEIFCVDNLELVSKNEYDKLSTSQVLYYTMVELSQSDEKSLFDAIPQIKFYEIFLKESTVFIELLKRNDNISVLEAGLDVYKSDPLQHNFIEGLIKIYKDENKIS